MSGSLRNQFRKARKSTQRTNVSFSQRLRREGEGAGAGAGVGAGAYGNNTEELSQSNDDLSVIKKKLLSSVKYKSQNYSYSKEIDSSPGISPLFIASRIGEVEILKKILEIKKSNINEINILTGKTPLYIAAHEGHINIIKVLLNNGGNPNISTKEGKTPLYIAAQEGHINIIKVLLNNGGNPNISTKEGNTLLCLAVENINNNLVSLLLTHKTNPNKVRDKDGKTPLFIAVEKKMLKL